MINVIKKGRDENTTFRPSTLRGDRRSSILHNSQQRSQSSRQQQSERSNEFQTESKFQQYTSFTFQSQPFASRQSTVKISPVSYSAVFGPTVTAIL